MIVFSCSVLAIQNDAPEDERPRFLLSYQKALDILGFGTENDFFHLVDQWKDTLNKIWDITGEILDVNPEIRD